MLLSSKAINDCRADSPSFQILRPAAERATFSTQSFDVRFDGLPASRLSVRSQVVEQIFEGASPVVVIVFLILLELIGNVICLNRSIRDIVLQFRTVCGASNVGRRP